MRMLMRDLAVELGPLNITVNNIAPGAIATPINTKLMANKPELNALLANIPLGRMGTPEEVAGARSLPRLRRRRLLHRLHLHHRRRPHPQLPRAIGEHTFYNSIASPPHSSGATSAIDSEKLQRCPAKSTTLYCRSP